MRTVTVVTGGAGGIGLAAAKIVGRDHAVVISDVGQARLEAAATELTRIGVTCTAVTCDVTDRQSVAELVEAACRFGKVTAVIHAAGVSPSMGDATLILQINAIGTLNIDEAFRAIADEGFAIVNVASLAAHTLPEIAVPTRSFKLASIDPGAFVRKMTAICRIAPARLRPGLAYALSKRFVVWYSQSRAADFGRVGARIVSVSPGSIDTRMGRLEEQRGSGATASRSALRRFGEPAEVAALLAFCASDKAGYLTGTDILCDGGFAASTTFRDRLASARAIS